MRTSRFDILLIGVVVLHLLVAGWFAWHRPIDGDEGYYGLAARLVAEGQTPYADFFYPQAPLLPYLYAPAAAAVGAPQLPDLRLVSVLLSGLTLALLAVWCRRDLAGWAAVAALLLAALAPELLIWSTTVKTYAFVNLAAVAGLVAFQRGCGDGKRLLWFAVGGACLGLAVSARLLYAPAALVPAVWLAAARRRDWRGGLAWLAGLAVALTPIWVALARDPVVFWFNNVGYHGLRFSLLEDASPLARVVAAVTVFAQTLVTSPGLLVLSVLAVLGLRRRHLPPAVSVSLWTAATLAVTCLVPDPVHRQYFTGALPVLLILPAAWALAGRGRRWWIATATAAPLLAVIGLAAPASVDLSDEPHWRLDHYRKVSSAIAEYSRPDDTVFAFWSGYVGGSGRRPYPGMENHFGVGVSERLDGYERRRFRIIGRLEMAEAFRFERPQVVVVGAWMNELNQVLENHETVALLSLFGLTYQGIEDIDGVKLAIRRRDLEARERQPSPR